MEVGILRRDVHIHPALDDNRRTGFGAGVGSFEDLFPAPYVPTISEPGGLRSPNKFLRLQSRWKLNTAGYIMLAGSSSASSRPYQ